MPIYIYINIYIYLPVAALDLNTILMTVVDTNEGHN
jgi:hypothetical protein